MRAICQPLERLHVRYHRIRQLIVAAVKTGPRFWEIDTMRGVAIITMIVYHTMWDLWYWGVLPDVVLWEGFWKYWQRFTAGTFLILVGVSMTIVYRRNGTRRCPTPGYFPKFSLARVADFWPWADHHRRRTGGGGRLR